MIIKGAMALKKPTQNPWQSLKKMSREIFDVDEGANYEGNGIHDEEGSPKWVTINLIENLAIRAETQGSD